jgi:alpha-glucoside transport system substrate-binding protein
MKRIKWFALLLAFALVVAACGDDDDSGSETTTTAAGGATTEAPMDDLAGTDVTIFGAFTTVEADAANAVITEFFNEPTGANAVYEGSESFEEQVKIRVDGGNPPDIALYPQPGSVVEQAASGNAIALEDLGFDIADLEDIFGEYLLSLGEYEGKHYGIPTNVNSKSIVWYNAAVFAEKGYAEPATWDEMLALADTMVADGYTPFCIGTGSEANTGWPATDWMEDIMLRTAGADVYDQWVNHEIPFNDPAVKRAAEVFAEVAFNEDYILGNTSTIPDIDFRDSPEPMLADPPGCLMHRQASFIVSFFPEGTVVGEDVKLFSFPDIDPGVKGSLIAGELGAVFRDAPEVRAFIESFVSTEAQCALGGRDGVQRISPNVNTTSACYSDPLIGTIAQGITDAIKSGGARFDASDLMPSSVGSGSFWTAMNEWMRGTPIDEVLQDVEDSWPAS